MSPEALLTDLECLKCDKPLLSQSLISAVKLTFLEKFPQGFERPCHEDDFTSTKKTRESHTNCIKLIVKSLADSSNQTAEKHSFLDDNELLAVFLVMCGENVTVQPWNNEVIVQNCQFVLSIILSIFNCSDISQLISKDHKVILVTDVFNLLSPNLLTSTWKYFPASVACFKWFLLVIKQPVLSSYLRLVLPPSLILVDDFINENKIVGVQCLTHIVKNVVTAELQFYGHGDVIFNALIPLIRMREADLLFNSIPLIILLATKMEFNFRNQNETKWSRFDSILEILLENMELEQSLELRSCYISHLGFVIDNVKHRIVRWSKRLLRIFEEYFHFAAKFNDEKTIRCCIEAMEKYTKFSEGVIPVHYKKLLYIVLVALTFTYNSSTEFQVENKPRLFEYVKMILKFTSKASFENFKLEFQEIFKNKKYLKYEELKNVIEEHS